jgi:hypothetical protein
VALRLIEEDKGTSLHQLDIGKLFKDRHQKPKKSGGKHRIYKEGEIKAVAFTEHPRNDKKHW